MGLGALAVGGVIVGGLLDAYSQYASYKEQKVTSKYNQAIIDANQRVDQALIDMDIRRIREEGEGIISRQSAVRGASGIKFGGSSAQAFMTSVKNLELDIISLELNKMVSAAGAGQAKYLEDRTVASAKSALPLNITSSIVGSVSRLGSLKSTQIAQKVAEE